MRLIPRPFGSSITLVCLCLCLILFCTISPAALAVIPIKLYDLSYSECPQEIGKGSVTSGGGVLTSANCFIVTGKTENNSGKPVTNADIFGRIYDANNNPIFQNRTRLGAIDQVPPGIGTFELRITVSRGLEIPLQFKQFKASGFVGKVR